MNYIGHNQWNGLEFDKFWEKITNNHYDKIIIFGQNEWEYYSFEYYEKLIDLCKSRNQPLYIITAAHKVFEKHRTDNLKLYFWDTYWLGKTWEALGRKHNIIKKINLDDTIDYKYHYISLNHRGHKHRVLLIDLLAKNDLFKYGVVTLHEDCPLYQWKYYEYKPRILNDVFATNKDQYYPPDEYYEAFAQLVSESPDKGIILSEKTAIPLILGKPFLIANANGYHKFLQEKGFKLYDEIFDYSFDEIEDETLRYEMLLENFKKLSKIPLNELNFVKDKIKDKIIYNKKLAKEIVYDEKLYPDIAREAIQHYYETGNIIDLHLIQVHDGLQYQRHVEW